MSGKVALITGASSGIGKATASCLAAQGARVSLVGRDAVSLEKVKASVEVAGGEATVVVADVGIFDQCRTALEATGEQLGGLDVLVNAAGILEPGDLENTAPSAWRRSMTVNLDAVYYLMHLAVPHLKARRGCIVNVSSVTGLRSFPGVLAYCVGKAAVDQLTRCAALELAADGVRVNAVNPGVVRTNLHRRGGMDAASYDHFLEHSRSTHPLGRIGEPREVAESILFLACDRSGWITGTTLNVDGGRHLTCAR